MPLDEYISGGYLATQFFSDPSPNQWMKATQSISENLLPDQIISVGLCGAPHAPVFDWMGASDDDYIRFGISKDRISELSQWANDKFQIDIGVTNIFFQLSTAQEYVQRFTDMRPAIQIVGIGLHRHYLHRIKEAENFHPRRTDINGQVWLGFEDTGFALALRRDEHYIPGGILGFDVICCDYHIDHSWHCNGLAVDALQKFNFRPNEFGLIDDKTNADQLAAYADELQPEPGVWIPVLVSRYPLKP